MRIVILLQSLGVGGTERQFLQLCERLNSRRHDVSICAIHNFDDGWRWMSDSESPQVEILQPERPVGLLSSVRQFAAAARDLRRLFEENDVQIAHCANVGLTAALAWLACRGRRRPIMVWSQLGGFGISDKPGRALHHRLAMRFARLVSARATALISNSEAGRRRLEQDGFRFRRSVVVANPIDTNRFRRDRRGRERLRTEWGLAEERIVVGIVGRPVPVKGHDIFIRAAAQLAETDPRVSFVVVTGDDRGTESPYRRLARDLGIDSEIRWEPYHEEMPAVFSAFDISCLSSRAEGFPNVVAESMACETPCVATDVGAVRWIVGELGVVVPPESPGALAKGLRTMISRLSSIDDRSIRQSIESRFGAERHVDEMEKVYLDLLREAETRA